MGWTTEDAESALIAWAQNDAARDRIITAAHRAGVSKNRIHTLTGVARTTIDRILAKGEAMTTYTLISANTGDQMPPEAVEISDPATPVSWDALPEYAQHWAEDNGYGDDDELLYVAPGEVEVPGWPTLTVDPTVETVEIAEHQTGRGGYSYPLAVEVSEEFGISIAEANDEILTALRQLVDVDGEGIILDRQPVRPELLERNPNDLDVDYWLTVTEETATGIREAIAASREAEAH